MVLIVNTTAPVASAVTVDSYMTVDEANTYVFENKLDSYPWDNVTDTQKGIALNLAAEAINRLSFKGSRTVTGQTHEFPRGGDTSFPAAIEKACAEIAFALIDGRNPEYDYESLRVSQDKVSGVEITSEVDVAQPHIAAGIPSATAWNMLTPYLRNIDTGRLERV